MSKIEQKVSILKCFMSKMKVFFVKIDMFFAKKWVMKFVGKRKK